MTKCQPKTDDTLAEWALRLKRRPIDDAEPAMPALPVDPGDPPSEPARTLLETVRRFHHGTLARTDALETPDEEHLPALLFPFRHVDALRSDFPLALHPSPRSANVPATESLADLLQRLLLDIAPGDDDERVLKDNLVRMERAAAMLLAETGGHVDAAAHLRSAGEATLEALALAESAAARFTDGLQRLVETIPNGTTLIDLRADTPLRLLLHAARARAAERIETIRVRAEPIRNRLRDLLAADLTKRAEGRGPDALSRTVGAAGARYIDPQKMARIVGAPRGAAAMPDERRERLERALRIIDGHLALDDAPVATVVHRSQRSPFAAPDVAWHTVASDVSRNAVEIFDAACRPYVDLFAALRVARLDLDGAYEPRRHDSLLESFGWRAFSRDEMLVLPPVIAIETPEDVTGAGMFDLSRLLRAGRPITVLVEVEPASDPGRGGADLTPAVSRFEIGYLGISCREALVGQSSAARPHHLMAGFERSCTTTTPALHIITRAHETPRETAPPKLGAWLHTGAALEGRGHPFFRYDPDAGATWARRFDMADNPQLDADWPTGDLLCRRTADGETASLTLAFTFADYMLLEGEARHHFRVVPGHCAIDDLVAVDEYLVLDAETACERIPFIWSTDGHGAMHRLAIDEALVGACRDRLGYWRTLQELAGVRNEHVREAVERERERAAQVFADERERLDAEHAAALERVRSETASTVLQQLARGLLGMAPSALAGLATGSVTAPGESPIAGSIDEAATAAGGPPSGGAPASPPPADVEPEVALDQGDDLEAADPWIDSALCTSCNDCLDINAQLFVYNGNKQALIGDPSAGTFAQLVQAAEKCPARCIHPGMPLNPNEPGLDALIERAKPFN